MFFFFSRPGGIINANVGEVKCGMGESLVSIPFMSFSRSYTMNAYPLCFPVSLSRIMRTYSFKLSE